MCALRSFQINFAAFRHLCLLSPYGGFCGVCYGIVMFEPPKGTWGSWPSLPSPRGWDRTGRRRRRRGALHAKAMCTTAFGPTNRHARRS